MLMIWVVIVQNRNLVFIVKRCIIRLFGTKSNDKLGNTATIDSSSNYASSFSSNLLPTTKILDIYTKNMFLFLNKKGVF